jgi:hypothetical protein
MASRNNHEKLALAREKVSNFLIEINDHYFNDLAEEISEKTDQLNPSRTSPINRHFPAEQCGRKSIGKWK